jgi:hypothetical protein
VLIHHWGVKKMAVRPLAESDIPQVGDLYWTHMRRGKGATPPALLPFLRELYFTNPFSDSTIPSFVYESKNGRIGGFLGGIVRKMSVCGQSIKAVFGGNLIVHPEYRSGLAAPRLLAALIETHHDLSMTDSANDISRKILERLGFRAIPALNIHWSRPLRPSHYAIHTMLHKKAAVASGLKFAAKPFCVVADSMVSKFRKSPFRLAESPLHGSELDVETLYECIVESRKSYSLWPDYDIASLQWLLSFMGRIPARGQLRKVGVRDDSQKIIGWYIYYVKAGAVGEVVQIGGDRKFTKLVLDHLFYDAWQNGVIALHGLVDSRRMADFSDKNCFFTCRGGWTLSKSRNPELLDILHRGEGFLSRLDGEWCMDPGA